LINSSYGFDWLTIGAQQAQGIPFDELREYHLIPLEESSVFSTATRKAQAVKV
jgi:hypothetical protein